MAGVDAYLLCATPRSGSTLLCGLLASTGVAGQPESYFRRPDAQSWADRWSLTRRADGSFDYRDYVRAAQAQGRSDTGVFGARVMWGTLGDMVAGLRAAGPAAAAAAAAASGAAAGSRTDLDVLTAALGRTRFVHLRREDTLAQAVSWVRAEQTGYWHPGDPVDPRLDGAVARYDAEQISATVRTVREHEAAWRDWFESAGVVPHRVRYEDLVTNPAAVTDGICEFLGLELPPGRPIRSSARRQADRTNAEWIARYRADQPGAAAGSG